MVPDRLAWLADRVPMWFRTRWPLKRFYWQKEELDAAQDRAKQMAELFGVEIDQ